ncbi:MAG: prepilin-type N-terminal cleavage/methylation domain-containing protein [Patescibacteria group bacterium]|nr:prepilin-type N-terminal cleavage/methylation domain-containing protein [Patescibacteria group bacterium]
MSMKKKKGFTLIELLVVIGIISILTGIVIVAVNPTRQLAQARNAARRNDILAILNAIFQYYIDNNGSWPSGLTSDAKVIGNATSAAECNIDCSKGDLGTINKGCTGQDFISALVPTYLSTRPSDPVNGTANTSYYAVKVEGGRVTVGACGAEAPATNISITR